MINPGKSKYLMAILALIPFAVAGVAVITQSTASANEAFVKYAPGSGDYSDKVRLNTVCKMVKQAKDDAIVFPGLPGLSHNHSFAGAENITASSTAEQLYAGKTSCTNPADKSSYWVPTLYNGNTPLVPDSYHPYYRTGGDNADGLQPMPFGIKMLAGDPKSTAPQDEGVAAFRCRTDSGQTITKGEAPMACDNGDFLEAYMHFPSCWDGVHLDSPTHRTHVAYPKDNKCDAAHPVRIPMLTLEVWYKKGSTQNNSTFEPAMHMSKYAMHADFFNAWDPNEMQMFVDKCFKANQSCEEITDKVRPPGVGPQHVVAAPKTKYATPTAVPIGKLASTPSNGMAGMQMGTTAPTQTAKPTFKIKKATATTGSVAGSNYTPGVKVNVVVTSGKAVTRGSVTVGAGGAFSANYRLTSVTGPVVVTVTPVGSTAAPRASA